MECCSLCHKNELPLVPKSWTGDDCRLCPPCFDLQKEPETTVIGFDAIRGGLLSRWGVEKFAHNVMVDGDRFLFTLAHLLDNHHKQLIVGNVPDQLLKDYRETGAIYLLGFAKFWEEMVGFY